MAIRDREQGTDSRGEWRPLAAGRDVLGYLPAMLAVGAVLVYAYLNIAYDRFYRGLGVDPSDVGLSYAGTLARSSGFVVAFLVAAVSLIGFPVSQKLDIDRWRRQHPTDPQRPVRRRFIVMFTLIPLVLLLILAFPLLDAGDAARAVRAGKPVTPIRLPRPPPLPPLVVLPLPVLAIRADPATIEPAGKPEDNPAVARLRGRRLLYLGQANATVVLYDPSIQQAVYVPAGSVVLRVSNCTTKRSPDPVCKQLQRY